MEDANMPTTSNGIADAITADLNAMGQAEAPPPVVETPAAAPETGAETSPAPMEETPSEPLKLTDSTLVEDPANPGEFKKWGEIKSERLRWKDYTQKTQAAAEMRRQAENLQNQYLAQQEALLARQAASELPELPEDDPYAMRIRAVEAQTQAYLAAQQAQQDALESERYAVAAERLEADVQRVASEYKLDHREMDIVGREMLAAVQRGEQTTFDDVAKNFVGYRETLRADAVRQFKEKHRVGSGAADISVPANGPSNEIPAPGSRSFADAIRAEIGALMR